MFDKTSHEVQCYGLNPYTLDGMRVRSKHDVKLMVKNKWMVLVNTGTTVVYIAFPTKADATMFYNSFQMAPCAMFRPKGETHAEVKMRDWNFFDCRSTAPLR